MRLLVSALFLLLISGCSEQVDTGPGEVRWDREICARCAMAVSDHNYSAQIRQVIPDQRSKLYKFDDIGCAVIWLDEQSWKDDPLAEIWVTDYRNGEWIDARKAHYVLGKVPRLNWKQVNRCWTMRRPGHMSTRSKKNTRFIPPRMNIIPTRRQSNL